MWTTNDGLVGQKVVCFQEFEECEGEVLAVNTSSALIRVRDEEDGEIFIGNQWEEL